MKKAALLTLALLACVAAKKPSELPTQSELANGDILFATRSGTTYAIPYAYPTAGLVTSSGTGFITSVPDNSYYWNLAARTASTSAPLNLNVVNNVITGNITLATATANGYLSSTDWVTFNTKQNASVTVGTTARTIEAKLGDFKNGKDYGMACSGTGDDASTLQTRINAMVLSASAAGTTLNAQALNIPVGHCVFTSGITTRPWIKLAAHGNVKMDFSALATGTAITMHNEDAPSEDGLSAGNHGFALGSPMGATYIMGATSTGAVIGLSLGNSAASSSDSRAMRDVRISNVSIRDFNTCMQLVPNDLYMLQIKDTSMHHCVNGVTTVAGANNNSGERQYFDGITVGQISNDAIVINTDAMDITFNNSSFDFVGTATGHSLLALGATAGYNKITFAHNHFEQIAGPLVDSNSAQDTLPAIAISNSKLIQNSGTTIGGAPHQALFQGPHDLAIDNMLIYYGTYDLNANRGMYMATASVDLTRVDNVAFSAYAQLISPNTLLNNDPLFATGTVGNDLYSAAMPTYSVVDGGNMSASVDNAQYWSAGGGSKAVKYVSTGTSAYYVVAGDVMRVRPGQKLIENIAIYGGTSTGTIQSETQFKVTSSNAALPVIWTTAQTNNLSDQYADNTDPAYTGTRNWWLKPKYLARTTIPAGYDQAQPVVTISATASGQSVWLGFIGVSSLN